MVQAGLTEAFPRDGVCRIPLAQSSAVSFPSVPKWLGTHLNVRAFPRLVGRLQTSMVAIANLCPEPFSSDRARPIAAAESDKVVCS